MQFEDLWVWKNSKELSIFVYSVFKNNKDFWFKDQIQRAAISIMNNIAEWYERATEKEKYRFFSIAKSSCAEVRSMLHIWYSIWYINDLDYNKIYEMCVTLSKMLFWFMKKLNF